MKRFLVKTIYTATESNKDFAGEKQVWFSVKDGRSFKEENLFPHIIDWYGYTRECDAKKSFSYKNCESDENWNKQVEIVEFEI